MAKVNHICILSDNLSALYLSETFSDITLVVDNERLPAHRVLLAVRSEYFQALLYGGMKETVQMEISLEEPSIEAFKHLLRYVYCGHIDLKSFNEKTILEILILCQKYAITELENAISLYVRDSLSIENVFMINEMANTYQMKPLMKFCRNFIDSRASDVIKSDWFLGLSANTLVDTIRRDSFYVEEIDVYRSVCEWIDKNQSESKDVIKDIISWIRLPLISIKDLLSFVRNSRFVEESTLLDALYMKIFLRDTDLNYRGCLLAEVNVALNAEILAQRYEKTTKETARDGKFNIFTTQNIIDPCGQGLVFKLDRPYIINTIAFKLDALKDLRGISYYIEISVNQKHWNRVIDHSQYRCHSAQIHHFPARVTQYVRLAGTDNTISSKTSYFILFDCFFTYEKFEIKWGLPVPSCNVGAYDMGADVIVGQSQRESSLICANYENYDLNTGYTWHELNAGAIVIRLAQPYAIDSMRLLLLDRDDRTYSYYIEVSVDSLSWDIVADKRDEFCRSWQILRFTQRPVIFIRITGTYSSANERFECVHFECPAPGSTKSVN